MKSFFVSALFVILASHTVFAQATSDSIVIDVSNAAINQDNPSVAISRKDKSLIVIGAASDLTDMDNNGMPAYTSADTGKSWTEYRLPLPLDHSLHINGEASITSDDAGNFYYAYITYAKHDSAGNISFATSSDAKNWENATPININIAPDYGYPDGVYISVDNSPSSLHHGRVYAVWNQFYVGIELFIKEGAYIAWSDNQCKTWSVPILLGSSDDYQTVRTGKQGEIYVAASDSSGNGHQLFLSTDGGATFTNPIDRVFRSYPYYSNSGYTGLKGILGFAAFPYASFDVDINSGRIYGVFGDYQGDVATLSYSYSDDNGTNWTLPDIVGINTQDSADRFDPWLSVDQKTGAAYLLYYSSESDPKNVLVAPCRMPLGDVLPDKPQVLSLPFNPLVVEETDSTAAYIGDHTSSDADGGVYVASWTQNRAGFIDADVFAFVSITAGKNAVEMPVVIHSQKPWLSAPYPNPTNGISISLSYYLPHASLLVIDLYDEKGQQVKHLAERTVQEGSFTEEYALGNISAGTYLIRMTTADGQLNQKFVVPGR